MMAGAERQRGLDLDPDPVRPDHRAVMRTMHREAAGHDRLQACEARRNPIPLLHGIECHRGIRDVRDQPSDPRFIGWRLEMNLDHPLPVRRFERRHGCFVRFERLGERVRESLRGHLVADEAGETGVFTFVHALASEAAGLKSGFGILTPKLFVTLRRVTGLLSL